MKPRFTDEHKWPTPYVASNKTDIRATFARAIKAQKARAEATRVKVTPMTQARRERGK